MGDGCDMKSVFSCSDFLSDMWQGGSNAAETLDCPVGGSTHLGRGTSTDLLNLIGQSEITDSYSRVTRSLAASSSNKDSSGGQLLMGEPVESNLLNSSMSHHHMLTEPFLLQQASTSFPQYDQHPTQLQAHSSTSGQHGGFHMDPIKQAKAICNDGMNATALQQQLADLKSRTSGLESLINFGMHGGASTSLPETGPAQHHTAMATGTLDSLVPQGPLPGPIPTPASVAQPPLSLQESQLRQLASLLGSANMAALQNMTCPAAAPSVPDTTGRGMSEQVSGGGKCHEHSSGDDDTGAIPELHKLTSAGDSFGDEEEHERAWEAKLDGSQLPPPEMKRMRRMLSNRESARRSRRRKQAHMQDLEVQNNKLAEANQKLQKELSALRSVAKEAISEKKRSQAALETLKHKVVHLLGEHDMVPKQDPAKKQKTAGQEAPMHASTGTDSDVSGSGRVAVKAPVKPVGSLQGWPSSPALEGQLDTCKDKPAQMVTEAAASPKSGSKRKASERGQSLDSGVKRRVLEL